MAFKSAPAPGTPGAGIIDAANMSYKPSLPAKIAAPDSATLRRPPKTTGRPG